MTKSKRITGRSSTSRVAISGGAKGKVTATTKQQLRTAKSKAKADPNSRTPPTIPPALAPLSGCDISPFDRILLLGEGDFSFSAALLDHYGCADLTATAFDDQDSVRSKYPTASESLDRLAGAEQTVLFGIDACKIDRSKPVKQHGPYDRIIFNFPHVGGKSTDVDRQIRANQDVLVRFFRSARALLQPRKQVETASQSRDRNRRNIKAVTASTDHTADDSGRPDRPGAIYLTIFDRPPYTTDWTVSKLAREAGLVLIRSERFQFDKFPGYSHVRTLGALNPSSPDKKMEIDDDENENTKLAVESGPGWQGNTRPARTFIFLDIAQVLAARPKQRRRQPNRGGRSGGVDSSSDDE